MRPYYCLFQFCRKASMLLFIACALGWLPRYEASARPAAMERAVQPGTVLETYVAAPDTNYNFRLVEAMRGEGYTTYLVEMTSQAWLTTNEVDRPVWKHWLSIIRPDRAESSKALLIIGGGSNGGRAPKAADPTFGQIAIATKSIAAELRMVPNQPLIFAGESQGRKEDSLIAYTWDKYLRTGDPKWPARLPMTKAVVRAMDTISAFWRTNSGGGAPVDGFVLAGASKRGWTTWSAAAVDKRVVAIIPCVIDFLNIEPSMLHHYAAYGSWSPAIQDYTAFRIMDWTGTPEFRALMKIEDPYEYRSRFTMPKFIINACDDQFFLPDSSQFYFEDLPGVKYLRYVPNADHSLRGSDALQSLAVCYQAVIRNLPLPRFSWKLEPDGSIRVQTHDKPVKALLWQATNTEARDFRIEVLGPKWESSELNPDAAGVYVAKVPEPLKGWTAFMVELSFPSGKGLPDYKFTTQVRVVPEVLPYKFQRGGTKKPEGENLKSGSGKSGG